MVGTDWNDSAANAQTFGKKGRMIVPSDTVDLDPITKTVQVVTAGNFVYLPVGNKDSEKITVIDAGVGFITIHQVRRVLATGTTATLVTCD